MTPWPYMVRDETTRSAAMGLIGMLNVADKQWDITIVPHRERRSLSQNALLWKWLEEVVKHVHEATGQDKDDIHEHLKQKFLTTKITEINGEISKRWSTKGLSKAEMSAYLDKIYAWATSEMGLLLPVPEDLGRGA